MVAQARKPRCKYSSPMSDHPQIILAGDIGGTKSNLAILSIENETLKIHRNHRFQWRLHQPERHHS